MKLFPSLFFAAATADDTCEKAISNTGCRSGKRWSEVYLRRLTGQTADTCGPECVKDEACQDFVFVRDGSCYLLSGECETMSQSSAQYYKCGEGAAPADPCDTAGCSDKCSNVDGAAVCNCSSNPLLILDGTGKNCVSKCMIANGGCHSSALCRNPAVIGRAAECYCGAGMQFGSDGRTCTSIAEANLHCPSSTCWTYEMVDGNKKCVMKTGSAATKAGCNMYLHCTPDIMDFRWNNAKLLGTNTVHNNANTDCPIETSAGLVGLTSPTGADKMWKHAPASCDSTVTRENVGGTDMIIITKSFVYQGDNAGKNVGSMIYLDDAASVTIDVCCKFKATQSATSDDIAIEAAQAVAGKLDAVGSWDGSLKVEFTDSAYAIKKTDAAILGESHYIKVSWTVGNSPIAQKVNWFVDDCQVMDVADASKKVDVIEDQCFASVISAINTSSSMLSTSDFKFTFKSFSFNKAGNGSQKISCNINFCLKDNNECTTKTDLSKLTCNAGEPEKWIKPSPALLLLD